MPDPFIIKVQRSLFTSDQVPQILIYNEDRSIYEVYRSDVDPVLFAKIERAMGGEPKAFLWATFEDGILDISTREHAKWQGW